MFKDSFSAENGTATLARIFALLSVIILALATLGTFNSYLEGQRELNLVDPAAVEGALQGGDAVPEDFRKGEYPPLGLVLLKSVASAVALLGLFVSLLMGKSNWGQILSLLLVCGAAAAAWLFHDLWQNFDSIRLSRVGEKPAPWTYFVQILLTMSLIMSPPALLWFYQRASLMDQYLVRGIASPIALCFAGFLAIWLVIDLTDNGQTFFSAPDGISLLGTYYMVQLPQMVLLVLPITLLLSLLYVLGRMSKSNEIVSMLGAGRSLFEVSRPIFVVGLYTAMVCTVLNYQWAPKAEARKAGILNELQDAINESKRGGSSSSKSKTREEYAAKGWMYRNSLAGRTWFVGRVPVDLAEGRMRYVAIWWQEGDGRIFRTYKADTVVWDYKTKVWTLWGCKIYYYDEFGTARIQYLGKHEIPDWRETPWHVVSSSYNADFLGVPELTTYLRTNADLPKKKLSPYRTHWHYSWAEPFRCFLIVLMATPLGIVHSRRGVLGGVAASIMIFFTLMFFDSMFLGLGRTGRVPSWLGAWLPNVMLAAVGAALFYFRSENKEIPKLKMPAFFARA